MPINWKTDNFEGEASGITKAEPVNWVKDSERNEEMSQDIYLNIGCTSVQFKDFTNQISTMVNGSRSEVEKELGQALNIIKARPENSKDLFQNDLDYDFEKIITDAWESVKDKDIKSIRIIECVSESNNDLTDLNMLNKLTNSIFQKFSKNIEIIFLEIHYQEVNKSSFVKSYELTTIAPMFSEDSIANAIQHLSDAMDKYGFHFDMSALASSDPQIARSFENLQRNLMSELELS